MASMANNGAAAALYMRALKRCRQQINLATITNIRVTFDPFAKDSETARYL